MNDIKVPITYSAEDMKKAFASGALSILAGNQSPSPTKWLEKYNNKITNL